MKPIFPMTVKRGNVAVKIYRQKSAPCYVSYVVAHYEQGFLKRSTFASLEKAREHGGKTADRLNRGLGIPLVLEGDARLVYQRAVDALQPLGIQLDLAAIEYGQTKQLLQNRCSLIDAVRFYVKHQAEPVHSLPVQKVVDELIVTREKDGSSDRHVKDLRSRLDRFAKSFQCEIAQVTAADMVEGFTRDVREIGHWGTGNVEATLNTVADHAFPHIPNFGGRKTKSV